MPRPEALAQRTRQRVGPVDGPEHDLGAACSAKFRDAAHQGSPNTTPSRPFLHLQIDERHEPPTAVRLIAIVVGRVADDLPLEFGDHAHKRGSVAPDALEAVARACVSDLDSYRRQVLSFS